MIQNVLAAYFSPTGNTEQVTKAIAKGVALSFGAEAKDFDFTLPKGREWKVEFGPDDLLVIGVPTYAGRVPNKLMPYIRDYLFGDHTLVLPVVTYGGRAYDDALAELSELLAANGFLALGGAAVPCRHAFAEKVAADRPTAADLSSAHVFGTAAGVRARELDIPMEIMRGMNLFGDTAKDFEAWRRETIPGNHEPAAYYQPLREDGEPAQFLKAGPVTDADLCNGCGLCEVKCPMGSIKMEDDLPTLTGPCIKCQACIKDCPKGALSFTDEDFLSHKRALERDYAEAAGALDPEYFLVDKDILGDLYDAEDAKPDEPVKSGGTGNSERDAARRAKAARAKSKKKKHKKK